MYTVQDQNNTRNQKVNYITSTTYHDQVVAYQLPAQIWSGFQIVFLKLSFWWPVQDV